MARQEQRLPFRRHALEIFVGIAPEPFQQRPLLLFRERDRLPRVMLAPSNRRHQRLHRFALSAEISLCRSAPAKGFDLAQKMFKALNLRALFKRELCHGYSPATDHLSSRNFTHTGVGASILLPLAASAPVFSSIRNTTTLSEP